MFAIPQSPPDELELPLFLSPATYGFPRPTQDYVEQTIDLNPRYIEHLAAIFYVWASGDSMLQAGIHSGDLLVVDRAVTSTQSAIVLACLDGEFTVKYQQTHPHPALVPANPDFPAIYLNQRQ